jgi:two-component system chemotaxis sensor kinase CheA
MGGQEEFLKRLNEAFHIEAAEHIGDMTTSLLAMEKSDGGIDPQILETAYRAAHSLKGAARAVDNAGIESICHAVESVFAAMKKGEFIPEQYAILFEAVEFLKKLLAAPAGAPTGATSREIGDMEKRIVLLLAPSVASAVPKIPPENDNGNVKAKIPEAENKPLPLSPAVKATMPSTIRMNVDKLEKVLLDAENLISAKLLTAKLSNDLKSILAVLKASLKEHSEKSNGYTDSAAKALLSETTKSIGSTISKLSVESNHINILIDELIGDSRTMLMIPCSLLLEGYPLTVRDLARSLGKEVDLVIEGQDVELEKRILEKLKDPLLHLVRNCVDHGIEPPEKRLAAGKSSKGLIRILVRHLDTRNVEIAISDDGKGLDLEEIRKTAVSQGLITSEEAETADREKLLSFIFHSGFSTSRIVTDISGRGLGLAIVQKAVEELEGSVKIDSSPGLGTSFHLIVPYSRATFKGIHVRVSNSSFIIPSSEVQKILRVPQHAILSAGNRNVVVYEGLPLAMLHLGDTLGIPRQLKAETPMYVSAVICGFGPMKAAFVIDEVINEQEVLVKPLGQFLSDVKIYYGATVLGDEEVVPVLNMREILKTPAVSHNVSPPEDRGNEDAGENSRQKSILVVEDSITSRMLIKSIFEAAGYKVSIAVDGIDALTTLKTGTFDLVVTDIEMPRMDGFELTRNIKTDKRLEHLPVILVTSLESREHKEKGIESGADAYIAKSNFAQNNLLETVHRFIQSGR